MLCDELFQKKKTMQLYNYTINGITLLNVDSIRDLGIIFSSDLSFNKHINLIVNNAYKKLGFIFRSSKYFKKVATLRLLYCSLVRSQLECASVVWAPYQWNHNLKIERAQHRFLRKISFDLGMPMQHTHHVYDLLDHLKLTLARRRIMLDMVFFYKLINGHITCSDLLEKIKFHIPTRSLRVGMVFHEESRTLYGKLKPFYYTW